MRFMAMVLSKDYGTAKPGTLPDEKSMAAMGKFNEELVKAGVMLTGEGLHPPSMGARLVFSKPDARGIRKPEVVDGPFSEAREVVGGFWILDVKNKEEAIEWMRRAPFFEDAVVEIRQVQELDDFEQTPAIKRERKLAEELKAKNEQRTARKK
jgi:hypothetical protein